MQRPCVRNTNLIGNTLRSAFLDQYFVENLLLLSCGVGCCEHDEPASVAWCKATPTCPAMALVKDLPEFCSKSKVILAEIDTTALGYLLRLAITPEYKSVVSILDSLERPTS